MNEEKSVVKRRPPDSAWILAGILWALLVFILDYLTIERYSFYLFYFPSVIVTSWYRGKRTSVLMVLLCTLAWLAPRLGTGTGGEEPALLIWNGLIRLATFGFIAVMVYLFKQKHLKLLAVQKQLEDLLALEKSLARHDPLTGALNSLALSEQLTQERLRCERYEHVLSLLYMDLDGFKEVNDMHGHAFGDEILKKVVLVIKKVIREVDDVARLGGDEFLILLPETDKAGALACKKRIQDALVKTLSTAVAASIGVTSFESAGLTNDAMIKAADEAMYKIKKNAKKGSGTTNT